ncbi:hypothetical protein GCM10025867_42460 [Frondihabitans sucicola]|uniref:Uncharacterized protein n=1 Tax=Frondihabitans sucicola TaxID=1268041 RepID=A0ABM8GU54_9MICO|nr:hypothetical protein GCM10025867_42460 [Frondihabitans sucicola]
MAGNRVVSVTSCHPPRGRDRSADRVGGGGFHAAFFRAKGTPGDSELLPVSRASENDDDERGEKVLGLNDLKG